jgi:hypothetical protein
MDGPAGPSGPQCSIFPRQVSAWTFSAAIALKSQRHAMGRDSRKEAPNGSWLPIIAVALTVVLWRLVGVAGAIWQDRDRVLAHCTQLQAVCVTAQGCAGIRA